METVEQRRDKYIKMFEDAIDIVKDADDIPQAAFIQVVFSSHQIVRMKQIEAGANLLFMTGMMNMMAMELGLEVLAPNTDER